MSPSAVPTALSPRELDVLALMADGLTNDAIAKRTFLSVKSVEAVIGSIFTKLGLISDRQGNRRVLAVRAFLDTIPQPGGELPTELSSFVGRTEELAVLADVLDTHRLLTITGPGGIGKTRLAVNLARRSAQQFNCVRFVDLSATAGDVTEAVCDAFGVAYTTKTGARRQLVQSVRTHQTLVVLDNAEHVLDQVRALVPVILGPNGGRVITTSRQPLGIPGEAVWYTPPLGPADGRTLLYEHAADLTGARARLPERVADAWCQRLEGMPLAIELIATRLSTATVEDISARLSELPHLLSRRTSDRHHSLRTTLASSVLGLAPDTQRVFRHTSLFLGGFTLDAARSVAADSPSVDVFMCLDELVQASLLEFRNGRYRFLEPIRQYGGELETQHTDHSGTRSRLIQWAIAFGEDAWIGTLTEPTLWRARLRPDEANFELAVGIACQDGDTEAAVRIIRALFLHWSSDRPTHGHQVCTRALQRLDGTESREIRAWAHLSTGALASIIDDRAEAETLLRVAVDLFTKSTDTLGESLALLWLGRHTGDATSLDNAVAVAAAARLDAITAWALIFRGALIIRGWESYATSTAYLTQAEALALQASIPALSAAIANHKAIVSLIGNWTGEATVPADEIEELLAQALRCAREDGGARTLEGINSSLCLARLHNGPTSAAVDSICLHLRNVVETDDRHLIAEAILIAAANMQLCGQVESARSLARIAGPAFRTYADDTWIAFVLHRTPELANVACELPTTQSVPTDDLVRAVSTARQILEECCHHGRMGMASRHADPSTAVDGDARDQASK